MQLSHECNKSDSLSQLEIHNTDHVSVLAYGSGENVTGSIKIESGRFQTVIDIDVVHLTQLKRLCNLMDVRLNQSASEPRNLANGNCLVEPFPPERRSRGPSPMSEELDEKHPR